MTDHHDLDTLLAESAWVRSLARSLTRSESDADDLVQDAWTAALRRPPSADRPVRPWLAAVVRNAARARFRGAARREAREDEVRRREGDVPSADALLGELELQEQLSALVRGLPEPQREAVVLRFHEGLSGAEIARRLDVPAGTVRWRIKSGLDALRAELDQRHGGDRAAWLGALAPLARPRGAAATPAAGAAAGLLLIVKVAAATAAAVAVYSILVAPLIGGGGGGGPLPPAGASDADTLVARAGESDDADTTTSAPPELDSARAPIDAPSNVSEVDDAPPVTRLRLRVVDDTGAPVAGASVRIRPSLEALSAVQEELEALSKLEQLALEARLRGTTDGQGVAEFESTLLRVDSNVGVEVAGPQNGGWSSDVAVTPGESVDLGDVVVTPRGRVFGVLRDGNGDPVSGRVLLAPPDSTDPESAAIASGHAGNDGQFEVYLDEAATVQLHTKLYHDERVEPCGTATVELGESVAMEARTSLVVENDRPRLLAVGPTGERIEAYFEIEFLGDATVKTSTRAQKDDLLSNAQFLRTAELVRIRATDTTLRHLPKVQEFRPPFGDFVLTLEDAPTRTVGVEVTTAHSAKLEGLVVEVDAFETRHTVQPESSSFDLELPVGDDIELFVRFRAQGCVPLEIAGVRAAEAEDPWKVELQPLPGIVGRVTFEGEAVPRARLHVSHRCDAGEWNQRRGGLEKVRWGSGTDHRAGRDGTFDVGLQWPGDWVMRVRARGFADALVDVSDYDPATGREVLDVELVRPGIIEGTVLDADGDPRAGVAVVASHAEHEPRSTRTGRDGRYRLRGVPPGDWMVAAPYAVGEGSGWSTLDLGEDWVLPTNATVVPGGTLALDLGSTIREVTAQVSVTGGALAPGDLHVLRVSASDGDPLMLLETQRIEAAADGTFTFLMPTTGRMDLSLRSASFRGGATWTLGCAEVSDEVMLDLPLATVDMVGTPGTRYVIKGTPIRDGGPRLYHAVTLDDSGVRDGVVMVAGALSVQVPGGVGEPRTVITLEPGSRERLALD